MRRAVGFLFELLFALAAFVVGYVWGWDERDRHPPSVLHGRVR